MNNKVKFAIRVLHQYALEGDICERSTSDLSPLEEWLILRLYRANKAYKENDNDTVKRELDFPKFCVS